MGVFPYRYSTKQSEIKAPSDDFEAYLKERMNDIQKTIIRFLVPLAEAFPSEFMLGIIEVWLNRIHLGEGIDKQLMNKQYEKLFQVITTVNMPMHYVLDGAIKTMENRKYAPQKQSGKKEVLL